MFFYGIGAPIRVGREIQCLPYAGVFTYTLCPAIYGQLSYIYVFQIPVEFGSRGSGNILPSAQPRVFRVKLK